MIKAVAVGKFRPKDIERLNAFSDRYDLTIARSFDEVDVSDAEVLIGTPSAEVLAKAPKMKWLQALMAGVNAYLNVDCFKNGTALTCITGAFGPAISEHVLTMLLSIYKGYPQYRDYQKKHEWVDLGEQYSPRGKTVLILGAGNIGTCTAEILRPFGCHIIGMRRVVREVPPQFDEMITMEELDETLPKADVVVGALPGTAATAGMIDARRIALMKDDAVLINVGRGNLIDDVALAEALNAGKLLGAGIDVTEPEPLPADHPLWDARGCLLTPHITGWSFGHLSLTSDLTVDICCRNLEHYAKGEPLECVVDMTTGYKVTD